MIPNTIEYFTSYSNYFDFQPFRSEYGAFWKCIQAGVIYAITQLCKMLVLATFFPDSHFTGTGGFDAIGVSLFIEFSFVFSYAECL